MRAAIAVPAGTPSPAGPPGEATAVVLVDFCASIVAAAVTASALRISTSQYEVSDSGALPADHHMSIVTLVISNGNGAENSGQDAFPVLGQVAVAPVWIVTDTNRSSMPVSYTHLTLPTNREV